MLSCHRHRYTRLIQSELLAYIYIVPFVLATGVAHGMRGAGRGALRCNFVTLRTI
jgi:hypothetical protein